MFFRISFRQTPIGDRQVRVQKSIAKFADKRKIPFTIAFDVVEEQAADAARFAAMLEIEVFIAPFLESAVVVGVMMIANRFQRAMKVNGVLIMGIVRREIRAAAKPGGVSFFEVAEIGVDRGNHRTVRVQYQRNSRGKEFSSAASRYFCSEFLRQISGYGREIHSGLFKYAAFFNDTGPAAAAALARPQVLSKRRPIQNFEPPANAVLQSLEILFSTIAPHDEWIIAGIWQNLEMQTERSEFEKILKEWVEIPSISAEPDRRADIERLAETAVKTIQAFGGEAEKISTPGNPVVVGRFETGVNRPNVTIYNHLDVQPANEPQWKREPFVFHQENGRYFGRGTTDDKGPALSALFGARIAVQRKTPVNIQLIWELEEEIGSPNFEHFMKANAARLRTDSVVVSDTIWTRRGRPAVAYGLRGLAPFRIVLETGTKDVHSGTTGGVARNPIGELCQLIAECYDARTGNVKIPGFYKDVMKVSRDDMKNFLASGFTAKEFQRAHELKRIRTKSLEEAVRRLWAHPTFEVHGMVGGYTGPGVKTAIAPRAEAKVSMRLVPNQDPSKIFRLVKNFIKKRNPDVQVIPESFLKPFLGPKTGPYADAASEAMCAAFGKSPAWVREGGSIGAVVTMQKYLKAPVVFLGLSLPEHGYHAPNENFDWEQASGGMEMFAKYFEVLGRAAK